MKIRVTLIILGLLLALPPMIMQAATPVHKRPVHRTSARHAVKRPVPKEHQQTVSFLPPPRVTAPSTLLTGKVVQQTVLPDPKALEPLIPPETETQPVPESPKTLAVFPQRETRPRKRAWNPFRLFQRPVSWVTPMHPHEAESLALQTAGMMAGLVDPSATTLILEAPKGGKNAFPEALTLSLRQSGFAIATSKAQVPEALTLSYRVTPLDAGVLIRLRVGQTAISRWVLPDAHGEWIAATPVTLGEALP